METEILQKKQNGCQYKSKLYYDETEDLVFCMDSVHQSLFCTKSFKKLYKNKNEQTWENQGYSGTHGENYRYWTYKNPETADRYSRPADQEARLFVYPIWDVCNPDTGM